MAEQDSPSVSELRIDQTIEAISYSESLSLASRGILSESVFKAMRNEILEAEKAGPSSVMHLFNVKINLGVAYMQFGNQNPDPGYWYDESEKLFMAVLNIHPEFEPAIKNLAAVRRNRRVRAGISIDGDSKIEEQGSTQKLFPVSNDARRSAKADSRRSILSKIESEGQNTCIDKGRGSPRFLTIGIPTVPRIGGQRYLTQTLSSILDQLPTRSDHPLYRSIIVVILNNRPGNHSEFDELKSQIHGSQYSHFFRFEEAHIEDTPIDPQRSWWHDQAKVQIP